MISGVDTDLCLQIKTLCSSLSLNLNKTLPTSHTKVFTNDTNLKRSDDVVVSALTQKLLRSQRENTAPFTLQRAKSSRADDSSSYVIESEQKAAYCESK